MPKHPTAHATCVLRQAFDPKQDEILKRGAVSTLMLQLSDLVESMDIEGLSLRHYVVEDWDPQNIYWCWVTPGKKPAYFHADWLRLDGPRFRTDQIIEIPPFELELEWDEDNDRLEYDSLSVVAQALVDLTPQLPDRKP